jgi:hypothetical protein
MNKKTIPKKQPFLGIYNKKDGSLLERCDKDKVQEAVRQWHELGYETVLGPAFKNLIVLGE